jgi:branched-chain amino acid transport system ATP-binding protein
MVMRVTSRIYVLEFGRLIASGSAAEVRANADVQRAYLGTLP